jgi:hypothetical protein
VTEEGEKGLMLNEQSIEGALRNIIDHLEHGNLEQAQLQFVALNFERLQKPIPDPSKGSGRRQFIDPAGPFGTERVNAVGRYLRSCREAVSRGDQKHAVEAAKEALKRWQQRLKLPPEQTGE